MNIFYLDETATLAARYLSDKHVPKMILETAQLLCSAHHATGSTHPALYKRTHMNHPCSLWVRASAQHYAWLVDYLEALCDEYEHRFNRVHATRQRLLDVLTYNVPALPIIALQPPPCVMPDEFIVAGDAVASYRRYYAQGKRHLLIYNRGRSAPSFL